MEAGPRGARSLGAAAFLPELAGPDRCLPSMKIRKGSASFPRKRGESREPEFFKAGGVDFSGGMPSARVHDVIVASP
jgi:hypothetical protein